MIAVVKADDLSDVADVCHLPGASEVVTLSKATMKYMHIIISYLLHCGPKNDTDVTHYRFNPHQPISVIFGRVVAERVCY